MDRKKRQEEMDDMRNMADTRFQLFHQAIAIAEELLDLKDDIKECLPEETEALGFIEEADKALEKAWKLLWPSPSLD